jgi:heme/copper-type cytochrome/quinol oxidase subunit 4
MQDSSSANIAQNIHSLELTLQEVWTLYDQNVPEYSEKCLIFLNGKAQFLNDLVYYVHSSLESENESISKILTEIKDKNHSIN